MNEKLSLSELQAIIRDSLYMALPGVYWVIAEISEIKENYSGHCYLELIEKHPVENYVRARVKGIIWGNRLSFINSYFENITGESLKEGLKILVKTKVEYHELYGLSLVITDIDPAFTIGEMAVKRQMILKKLEQDGVFSMNKELDFPLVPQRIAIISSKNAAGYSDFIKHLKGNNSGYAFLTVLFETSMQGIETEQGIISALDLIAIKCNMFDIVVIIRGGGSQSDLSWYDSYDLAYHITQFPLPVLTGIGHEKDISVTDMVAHMSLKTPTAVADYLVECIGETDRHINEIGSEIKALSHDILEKISQKIESSKIKLIPLTRIMISDIKSRLTGKVIDVVNVGKGYILKASLLPANQMSRIVSGINAYASRRWRDLESNKKNLQSLTVNSLQDQNQKLEILLKTLNIMRPENVLSRGYTITSLNGKILKKSDEVKTDDLIDTQFVNGSISSIVTIVPPEKN